MWRATCCLQEPHLYPSTSSQTLGGIQRQLAQTRRAVERNPILVWSGFWVVCLSPEFQPVWPVLLLTCACSTSRCFAEDGASRFTTRDSEKEAVAGPVSPREEYLGALSLSVQAPLALFSRPDSTSSAARPLEAALNSTRWSLLESLTVIVCLEQVPGDFVRWKRPVDDITANRAPLSPPIKIK